MAKGNTSNFVIGSIRGGMNDQDPPHALQDDQCTIIKNVEFFFSTLGERRNGCVSIDIANSTLDAEAVIVHLGVHNPLDTQIYQSQLWAVGATIGTSATLAYRGIDQQTWTVITPTDAIVTTLPAITHIQSVSLHGKFFISYYSSVDRLHVFDANGNFRRVGLAAPVAAPTAVDTGSAGSYVDDRIFRVRFIEMSGSTIIRRSEPSPELTFTPSGTNDGAVVTRPAAVGEGETHWELEASDGDGNFYVIATVAIGTTTYTDTTQPATDYALNGTLSADIGDYALIYSPKYLKVDQDRLVVGGAWNDSNKNSRVSWTPVANDPGNGNDERIPASTDNYIDLDWQNGGELTGLSDPLNGVFYAFKLSRIYKFQRTGRFDKAYEAFLISSARGALPNSIISGVDEFGKGCIYFLDPSIGPMRIGTQGLQHIQNIRGTWRRVNEAATSISCHGVFYPDKHQIHWWVAADGAESPTLRISLQTNEVRSTQDGTERGWFIADGTLATAWCSVTFPEVAFDETTNEPYLSFRPYIGLEAPNFIQRTDVSSTDAGDSYRALIVTKPYLLVGLLNRWGAMTAALLASPNHDPDLRINVKFIKDFGTEVNLTTTNFVPEGNELQVIKPFDDLAMSNARAMQVEFSDP